MKRAFLIVLAGLSLLACDFNDGEVKPYDGFINWTYMDGPNGEHCLFAAVGNSNSLSCDTINWPEDD
jgi:hypothetical protein